MKAEYDFSKGRRGPAVPTKGKTRITIYIESARTGVGYQTLINKALAHQTGTAEEPMTAEQMRKIVREQLAHTR
jgi:hypothetical protein